MKVRKDILLILLMLFVLIGCNENSNINHCVICGNNATHDIMGSAEYFNETKIDLDKCDKINNIYCAHLCDSCDTFRTGNVKPSN